MSIEIDNAIDRVVKTLTFVKMAKANTEMIFRCPFCGDTQKTMRKGHLYLNLEYLYFSCFRCEATGTINTLIKLFVGGPTVKLVNIKPRENKIYSKIDFIKCVEKRKETKEELFTIPDIRNIPNDAYFNKYLNFYKRIFEKNVEQSIFNKFLNFVRIQKSLTLYPEIFLYENQNSFSSNLNFTPIINNLTSVMFIGFRKIFYGIRDVVNEETLPGCKYLNFRSDINTDDFFVIINQEKHKDLYSLFMRKTLNVGFCEGAFDAINLYLYSDEYFSCMPNKEEPDIFVATASKNAYMRAIKFIFNIFMTNIKAMIFLDPDVCNIDFCNKLIKKTGLLYKRYLTWSYKPFLKSIDFFYNRNGFDYGNITKNGKFKIKHLFI